MKKIIALCLAMAVVSSGCSLKKSESAENMPPDKPWNRIVMETDSGYYYGLDVGVLSLRYTEKSNGADIFLCAKPECTHSGEEICTATYNFMPVSNYILYDGGIYFVANTTDKETVGTSLYKASPDGTSLDKIADIRRVKTAKGHNGWGSGEQFIIHKGYAYIGYTVGGLTDYSDFIEDGFVRVDIKTGKVETIFSNDTYMTSTNVKIYSGCGDYVYYYAQSANGNKSGNGYCRYNINDGTSEKISGTLGKLLDDNSEHTGLSGITEKTLYAVCTDKNEYRIEGYDANTLEPNGFELDLSDYNLYYPKLFYYEDNILVCGNESVKVYSDKGELIGEHECQRYMEDNTDPRFNYDDRQFDISDGKLYIGYKDDLNDRIGSKTADYYSSDAEFSYYSCPIEDIINGTGEWEKAYTVKNWNDFWDNDPMPKFIDIPNDVQVQ